MASTLWQDIRYGARMLLKNPGVTIIVIIALALGIGANTAIFSVVNAVLLRPLPYHESDRLVFLNEKSPVLDEMSISYPNFTDWRNHNQSFEKMGVYNRASYNLTGTGEAERIVTGQVSADLFSVLRVNALHGRVFTNEEDKPGGTPVVVLSYRLWQRRFGGQTSILNQAITLNGKSYTVIGIMPEEYLVSEPRRDVGAGGPTFGSGELAERGNHPGLYGVARLKPGVTFEQAEADMNNIAANLEKQYPDTNTGNRVRLRPLHGNLCRRRAPRALGDLRRGWFRVADCLRQHRKPCCWRGPPRARKRWRFALRSARAAGASLGSY